MAMLRISSLTMTVLPTPAPPKIPILPPLVNGRNEVDDLDARLQHLGLCALLGERRRQSWMGARRTSGPSSRAPSSMGRPSTSKMRPSVFSPMGTVTGAPVRSTLAPRAMPSVGPRASVRTSPFSSTNSVSRTSADAPPPRSRFRASWTPGTSPRNSTSITGPCTLMTVPSIDAAFPLLLMRSFLCWPGRGSRS